MAEAALKREVARSAEAGQQGAVRRILDKVKAEGRTSLTAPEGKLVCDAYGIPVPQEGVANSAQEAAKLASGMGFPVVLKIVSPDILHKTEAGGVLVGTVGDTGAWVDQDPPLGASVTYAVTAVDVPSGSARGVPSNAPNASSGRSIAASTSTRGARTPLRSSETGRPVARRRLATFDGDRPGRA